MMSRLLQPLKIGNITLNHRMVMALMTRLRADQNFVPHPFVKDYYAQRASVPATLVITEATYISAQAVGIPNCPGIYSKEQIVAWKEVTDAVHAKGSYIILQLWALGRVADPRMAKAGGFEIKAPSPIPFEPGQLVPKEISIEDIDSLINDYVQAARNAMEAGFDGVELHAANGYLVDQFIQDVSNQRKDSYGGSIENRSRFVIEAATAIVAAVGCNKVGVRLSPFSKFQGMRMKDPVPQFMHVVSELKKLKLAYLHLVESHVDNDPGADVGYRIRFAVDAWNKTSPVIMAGRFTVGKAKAAVDEEFKDQEVAIAFGRYFLSTSDLPFRVERGLDLAPYNSDTFYKPETRDGYVDYPFSEEWKKENP